MIIDKENYQDRKNIYGNDYFYDMGVMLESFFPGLKYDKQTNIVDISNCPLWDKMLNKEKI